MQCSLKVGLQLPIALNRPRRLSLGLAANLTAISKQISGLEALVSTQPLQRWVRAMLGHQVTTGSEEVPQEPLLEHQVSHSGQPNILPTQTGPVRFTLPSRLRLKLRKL